MTLLLGSNFTSFSFVTDYLLVRLTSKKAIKGIIDRQYLTTILNLPDVSFNLFGTIETAKFLLDNNCLSSQIGYVIFFTDTTKEANIMYWHKRVTYDVLISELYILIHGFDIKKQHWRRHEIKQKKSCQYQDYGKGRMGKHEIGKDRINKYKYLVIFKELSLL